MAIWSAAVLALLAASSSAQTTNAPSNEHVWSSVAWVLHGERTPLWGPTVSPALTPLGAQQMFAQGSLLRDRYLREDPEEKDATFAPIEGIERNAIDNTQLSILTNADQHMVTSVQAFLQGLYPPILQAFSENSGGIEAARFANGSIVNYPLQGYQYPAFRTASVLDFESIWVGGHVGCTKYTESLLNFRADDVVATIYNNTKNFYQNLWVQVLHEVFPSSMANFANAYILYDYAQFRYTHNNSTRKNITADELAMMARFASTEQRNKNANLSVSGTSQGDMIRAVAGRTMAAKTLSFLRENIRLGGATNKINIAFTTLETFVAWFALSGLVTGEHMAEFKPLPEPGGMMVFELFSIGGRTDSYPELDNLWVRFLYRNGTDPGDQLTTYSLFNSTLGRLPFREFMSQVQSFDVSTIAEWCKLCDGVSLFCSDLKSRNSSPGLSSGRGAFIQPTVAGAIGAAVTLAVAGLLFFIAILLGVIRFHRTGSDTKACTGTLGGFKGAEKMSSDTDLAWARGGTRHERTGSWELRGKKGADVEGQEEGVSPSATGVTVRARDLTHPSKGMDDDAISIAGQEPVKPREF
ncbi:histidine phosphatase superfamily [Immersiella caudata]|uniref:Histidine phosphatase superfamily n=1 Tax=Immersiella caudata TaxID=314043 RepID=A0AA40C6N0_9PEZI|nr:histidine phosphatase superfamily [Immersiella caudata]